MPPLERQVVISGLGSSTIGRRLGRPEMSLTLDACLAAIDDAGLSKASIDGLAGRPSGWSEIDGFSGPRVADVQDAMRLDLNWVSSGPAGNGQLQGVIEACAAVAMGFAEHVLVYRSVSESSTRATSVEPVNGAGPERVADNLQWLLPFGARSGISWLAMFARRHMHEFGTTREQLGHIALNARRNATINPTAVYRSPLSMGDYLGSRMVSSPLCLYDCDVPVDGAVAFVLSRREYAAYAPHGVAHVNAIGSGLHGRPLWDQWHDMTTMAASGAARALWNRTELRPDDVDVAELYDGSSVLTMFWLEALGFCGRGESGAFVEGGERIALGGVLPLNTAGGQLSAGRLHGHGLLHEACLQLRGQAATHQVQGSPEVALVSAGGGPAAACMLLTSHEG